MTSIPTKSNMLIAKIMLNLQYLMSLKTKSFDNI